MIIMQFYPCAQSVFVQAVTGEFNLQVMVMIFIVIPGGIAKYHRFIIDVVYDQIHGSVIIQVRIGGTVRESRDGQTPGFRYIREGEVSIIAECRTVYFYLGDLVQYGLLGGIVICLLVKIDKIVIGHILWIAAGDDNVAVTVIIKIDNQGGPAPVCLGNSAVKTDLTEYGIPD